LPETPPFEIGSQAKERVVMINQKIKMELEKRKYHLKQLKLAPELQEI
jgi:hypothetical protein